MTNRRGFLTLLPALAGFVAVPPKLVEAEKPKPDPLRMTITVNVDDARFKKAVVNAVLEDYNNAGALRVRDIINNA